jgi:hypothetical protein
MLVKDSPLAKALIKGRKHELPPSGGYARLGSLWIIPGAKGTVRLMARVKNLPEPAKAIRDAGFTREPATGYPSLRTSDEKVARAFIAWSEDAIAKATPKAAPKKAAAAKTAATPAAERKAKDDLDRATQNEPAPDLAGTLTIEKPKAPRSRVGVKVTE